MRRYIAIAFVLTFAGLGFRLYLALRLPNDAPDDGRLYARIAVNVLEHRGYSIDKEEPYSPTYIRVPGYPVFLAGVYALFGKDNNRAVRVAQAMIDTCTCWLIALLAVAWAPSSWSQEKRRRLKLIALGAAVCCPFPAIYVATILTETWTTFLATACALAASRAMKAASFANSAGLWALAGGSGGLATLCRPDSGLFVAAVGFALVIVAVYRVTRRPADQSSIADSLGYGSARVLKRAFAYGVLLTAGFCLALAPWAIRNARVFGVFQPIAPAEANMPGEFVPRGYMRWLKTWVDDVKYTETMEWSLDNDPIHVEQIPNSAFDSQDERERVARLLDRYNNADSQSQSPSPSETDVKKSEVPAGADSVVDPPDKDEDSGDEADSKDETESDEPNQQEQVAVEMTPDIDAGFAEIASERIARRPLRYYLTMPLRRAASLWFDTHSQYYPFSGELFPLSSLDREAHQQYWLPAFMILTLAYTFLGVAGVVLMWMDKGSRRWVLLLALLIIPRFAFLAGMENPEPRYVVEFFALVIAVAGLAIVEASDRVGLLRARTRR